mmetsp:Transcript_83345/g.236198  ORF Transcript_83345/g.236198 Transcript_83345/m.236198 type:complete len:249 (+) Transcript_83345:134-880(+)
MLASTIELARSISSRCRAGRPSGIPPVAAPPRSPAPAGWPSGPQDLRHHCSGVRLAEGPREAGTRRAPLHVRRDVRPLGQVNLPEEHGHVIEVGGHRDIGHGELPVHQPLRGPQQAVQRVQGRARRRQPRAAHARAEAQLLERGVCPDHPLRVLGALLRGPQAPVLVGEVEQDRPGLKDLHPAVVRQVGHLAEGVRRGPRVPHLQLDARFMAVPVYEGRSRLLVAVQARGRQPHPCPRPTASLAPGGV